jgi:adenine-specific DNA-methyltransferase
MMIESHIDGKSEDILEDNINKLKQLFPEIVTENKIDFDKLKLILGNEIEESSERYNFTWPGKTKAIKESQKQSTGTLRPCKEESKNWDTTKNLYIEGDNLEVLKLLQKTYYGKIKMIYIDPPYNTGNDFVYSDNYTDNLEHYLEITGQKNLENNSTTTNTETNGRYHSNWLNMMYPRLLMARNLLKEDGAIFISIDNHELVNLKKICDEIFGEENFITIFNKKGVGGRQDSKHYAVIHEYILTYALSVDKFISGKQIVEENNYPYFDEKKEKRFKTQLLRKWGANSRRSDRPNLFYPIKDPDGNDVYPMLSSTEEGCWRWSKDKMSKEIEEDNVFFKKKNNEWIPYQKIYEPPEDKPKTKLYSTWIDDVENSTGKKLLNDLLNGEFFKYPKPTDLIEKILKLNNLKNDDIILDFFSGSATTAHAIFENNKNSNLRCNFILIQLPEQLDNESEAFKKNFTNICEIGKERIRKAGEKILEESENKDLDVGFKVFKLDSSNLEKWDPDYNNLEQTLITSKNNIKSDRTGMDLVCEIMLKYGIDLTLPIEEHENLYSIGAGALVICLENTITTDIVDDIMEVKGDSEFTRVVFKDNGFKSDSDKTNIKESLNTKGIDEFITF